MVNLTQETQPTLLNELSASRISGDLTIPNAVNLRHNGSVGLIDGDLELSAGATYSISLTDVANFDELEVTGNITLDANLVIDTGILIAAVGDEFRIINNSSRGAVSGTFAGLP